MSDSVRSAHCTQYDLPYLLEFKVYTAAVRSFSLKPPRRQRTTIHYLSVSPMEPNPSHQYWTNLLLDVNLEAASIFVVSKIYKFCPNIIDDSSTNLKGSVSANKTLQSYEDKLGRQHLTSLRYLVLSRFPSISQVKVKTHNNQKSASLGLARPRDAGSGTASETSRGCHQ